VPLGREWHRLLANFRIYARNIRTPRAADFLRLMDRHRHGPLIVVQYDLSPREAAVRRWLGGRPL
jgi:hypothetical protein